MRLLLVEDDRKLSSVLTRGFREQHLDVVHVSTFADGSRQLSSAEFDVVVLDVMLPDGSGFELCSLARRLGLTTPILMLTARDAVEDRVRGLEGGADDYLTKPFAFPELVARVRALARRPPAIRDETYRIAGLEVNLNSRHVQRDAQRIVLTSKEFALLECFVRQPGRLLDRSAIIARVWDENHDPFTNAVEVLVNRLRKKIDDGRSPKLIHTVRGAGYWFGLESR